MKILLPPSKQPIPDHAKKVFSGVIFDVYQWKVVGYDGKERTFEKLKRRDTVLVVGVTMEKKIILLQQEQPGILKRFYSVPGGRVDDGEDLLAAAKREFTEETGYSAKSWKFFTAVRPMQKIDYIVPIFIAQGCMKTDQQELDGAEKIEVLEVSFEKFLSIVGGTNFADFELSTKMLEFRLDAKKMTGFRRLLGLG